MADLLNEATLVYTRGGGDVELMVTTPAKKGSIIVEFLVQATSPETLEVLSHIGFSAAGGALGIPTLINTIKKLKNRKIVRINIDTGSPQATVVTENGDIVCDKKIAEMIGNKKIRDSLHKIIQAPLHDKPNAEFKVLDSHHHEVFMIEESRLENFNPLPAGSLEEVSIENLHISISFAQVNFDSKRGWKIVLPDGKEKSALMQDSHFLSKAKANEQAFKKGDLYEAKIRVTTTERPSRSTILYEILEITRHWVKKEDRII
ncbi:Uncharacterized protein ALO94_01999 [Pseudomonas syringae pv. spinaceae]|uniref:Uncharacterized protein n=4 Tax=Pseudomonas syringae TaxID=317 RepID=A0A0P9ZWE3_PSESX|nr:Uncharacterized protein ALO94_01999 [Pseudomonas syringae pv. spinaceae]